MDSISLGPLIPNIGLFQVVYSSVQNKKGSIILSFTACRDMMPDPAFYAQCLQEAYEELRDATLGGKKAPAKGSTARKKTTARKAKSAAGGRKQPARKRASKRKVKASAE